MKTFKNLLCLTFIAVLIYSCEPEELPENSDLSASDNITAHTGDKDDEYQGRGDD